MIQLLVFFYRMKAACRKAGVYIYTLRKRTIDVGAGSRPLPFADVLVDEFINDNRHRQSKSISWSGDFIVCASIQRLPFKRNAFDFSYCSHVLEHTDDPGRAASELSRISPRGYIEVPTATSELFFNRSDHLWVVSLASDERGGVYFKRKPPLPLTAKDLVVENKGSFALMYYQNFRLFNHSFIWEKSIQVRVLDEAVVQNVNSSENHSDPLLVSIIDNFIRILFRVLRKLFKGKMTLEQLCTTMQCRNCRNSYQIENSASLRCEGCGHRFKVTGRLVHD